MERFSEYHVGDRIRVNTEHIKDEIAEVTCVTDIRLYIKFENDVKTTFNTFLKGKEYHTTDPGAVRLLYRSNAVKIARFF